MYLEIPEITYSDSIAASWRTMDVLNEAKYGLAPQARKFLEDCIGDIL